MKKLNGFLLTTLILSTACTTFGRDQTRAIASDSIAKTDSLPKATTEANLISLEKYENGIALFRVGICPADGKINVDVNFLPSDDPSLVYAELSFQVPRMQCFANTFQRVPVNVETKIKEAAILKGIKASYILMKNIPNRIEVNQF